MTPNHAKLYTQQELEFLKKNYQVMTSTEIGRHLNRSASSVRAKAVDLGIKKKDYFLTCKDINFIRDNYQRMTAKEIANAIGRSESSVQKKLFDMRIIKKVKGVEWTPEMLKLLRDFFPIMFNDCLAKWLGVSVRTLVRKARELGLQKVPDFYERKRDAIRERLMEGREKYGWGNGVNTRFKKGDPRICGKQFEKGHMPTEQTRAKMSEAMRKMWARRKQQELEQKLKAQITSL